MSNHLVNNNKNQQNQQKPRVVIDDGSKTYDIVNKRGDVIGEFVFVPADMGIIERYDHAVSEFESIQAGMEEFDNGTEAIKAASDRMKREIDILFNADISGDFFSITSPFTILESGEFFVVNVLNAVKGIIEKETGIRLNRAKTRASKYTKKYHK